MAAPLILVVEDDRADESRFLQILAEAGYRTRVVRDGVTTLRAVREARPDAVLLDLNIPDVDGLEVARRLRADAFTRHIPVVAVTAYQQRYARDVAASLGCRGYFTKPCDPGELQAALRSLVGPERTEAPAGALAGVRVLVVDDQDDSMEAVVYGLRRDGADVRVSLTVADGLRVLEDFRPDVVLTDLGFPAPGEDGYALVRAVRARAGAAGTLPVVAVTGYAAVSDQHRAAEAGFDRFLAKPVSPDVVVDAVVDLLRSR
jgi:CheY-like chemotaxis protein